MGLTRSLNVLMICAAFAFVAALIAGVILDACLPKVETGFGIKTCMKTKA